MVPRDRSDLAAAVDRVAGVVVATAAMGCRSDAVAQRRGTGKGGLLCCVGVVADLDPDDGELVSPALLELWLPLSGVRKGLWLCSSGSSVSAWPKTEPRPRYSRGRSLLVVVLLSLWLAVWLLLSVEEPKELWAFVRVSLLLPGSL
jgi:hypothetical protein